MKMIITNKNEEIIVNSHFASKSEDEIALNMSNIIADLINRIMEDSDDDNNVKMEV